MAILRAGKGSSLQKASTAAVSAMSICSSVVVVLPTVVTLRKKHNELPVGKSSALVAAASNSSLVPDAMLKLTGALLFNVSIINVF